MMALRPVEKTKGGAMMARATDALRGGEQLSGDDEIMGRRVHELLKRSTPGLGTPHKGASGEIETANSFNEA